MPRAPRKMRLTESHVARMALLLAGLPVTVPGLTVNRLCASGMEAVGAAYRAISNGDMELAIAAGVESMTRAPDVLGKAEGAFGRGQKLDPAAYMRAAILRALREIVMPENIGFLAQVTETFVFPPPEFTR